MHHGHEGIEEDPGNLIEYINFSNQEGRFRIL